MRTLRVCRSTRLLVGFVSALLSPLAGEAESASLQGFGASTQGGAGRAVVHVTNLNDSGPGSLREAVSRGDRTVVFDVGGQIALSTYLYVLGANITIDGFTAPAPGITIKNYGLIIRGNKGAHDVIVRGIRIRNAAIDGIQIAYGAYNVVIDHVSVTGSTDGNVDITEGSRDVTVSWSILGANGKNMLVKYKATRISLHHNVFVASTTRSPQVRIDDGATAEATETTADIRNNVIANWGSGYGTIVWYGPWANVVNNVYSTAKDAITVTAARAHVAGNLAVVGGDVNRGTESRPFAAPAVDTEEACVAAGQVLAGAGVRPVDAIDQQLLSAIAVTACGSVPPLLAANPLSLSFQAVEGGANPPPQALTIEAEAGGAADWQAAAATETGGSWLRVAPASGTTPAPLAITTEVGGLDAGIYAGTVTVTPQDTAGLPLSIPVVLVVAATPSDAEPLQFPIANRSDDAREAKTGVVRVNEKSLALGDGNLVAFRFTSLPIPRGVVIGTAFLEVMAINNNYLKAPLRIRYSGEATDNSAAFAEVTGAMRERPQTTAVVDDVPGPWILWNRHPSPDLRAIVQEIVSRPGWKPGQALTVFVEDTGSSGKRLIGARDNKVEQAAVLKITYWSP